MQRFRHFRFALLVMISLAVGGLLPQLAIAQESQAVAVNAPAKAPVSSTFTVTIDIQEVSDLNAAQYDITFDNTVLELTEITEGWIGGTSVPVLYNQVGTETHRVINSMELGTVTGSGTLAKLWFRAIGEAGESSTIGLSNGILSGLTTGQLPATWSDDSVELSLRLIAVGGDVYTVNKAVLLAPWLIFGVTFILVSIVEIRNRVRNKA